MEVEGLDLVALLEGDSVSQFPDDLDDLFPEGLMQFLSSTETSQPLIPHTQQPSTLPIAETAATLPVAPAPTVSSSSSQSGAMASSSPLPLAPAPAPGPVPALAALAAQPVAGVPRLVTTTAAQQMWTAMFQVACGTAPVVACVNDAQGRTMQPAGTSRQGSRECSADSSDTDQDEHEMVDSKSKVATGNKRKAPEVDWRQIEDPAERRRQRRLAKNRVTAARSRERKKAMWSELEEKLKNMENENMQLRAMLEQFARENASLKSQLLNITRAGAAAGGVAGLSQARSGKTMDPAAILPVFIVTLLVVCSLMPGDKACALLGSVLPLALVACVLGSSEAASGHPALESLFRLLHMLGTLVSSSAKPLQRSFKRLLFERDRYLGRWGLGKIAGAKVDVVLPGLSIRQQIPGEDDWQQSTAGDTLVAGADAAAHHCMLAVLKAPIAMKVEPVL